jgi:hypothetical protein
MRDERGMTRPGFRTRPFLATMWATAVASVSALLLVGGTSAAQLRPEGSRQQRPINTSPPTISGSAAEGRTLRASTGLWAGSATASYSFQWQRCDATGRACRNIAGANASRYVVAAADVGARLRVVVQAANAAGSGEPASSAPTSIVVGRPRNTARPTVSGSPSVGQTLTATTGNWAGSATASYSFQWERCDPNGRRCGNIPGATRNRYVVAPADVGSRLRVVVQASNATGPSAPAASALTGVVAGRPQNLAGPTISGASTMGQTLTANPGSWAGRTAGYSYQWQRCDQAGRACRNIPGATASRYVVTAADVGFRLRVVVQTANAFGTSAPAPSPVTAPVGLGVTIPQNTSLPTVSGSAAVGQTLAATTGSWAGSPTASYSFQWQRCDQALRSCSNIPGATLNRYVVAAADVGTRLRVVVQATNAAGASAPTPSAPTAVIAVQGIIRLPGGRSSVPASSVVRPERLIIDRVRISPPRISRRTTVLTARFHVSDTRGYSVRDALVYATGVPYNRLSRAGEVRTRLDGWATVRFRVLPALDFRRTSLIVMFVRARKQGESVLAGVSTRRLVGVRVNRR